MDQDNVHFHGTAASATPLFRQLLGEAIDTAAPCVRRLHHRPGTAVYRGAVVVERGRGALSRLMGWSTGLPPGGEGPIEVEIIAAEGRERWTRRVGGRAMASRLWAHDGLLCERLGAATFGFRLRVEEGAIRWRVVRVRVFGLLPLPAAWFAGVDARESGDDHGRYCFDVCARMPVVGLLVHYRGWLAVP